MKLIRRETTLTTRLFRVEHRHYLAPDGTTFERDVVMHPGAVVILPVLDDGRVVLIRNYRTSVGRELIELPAGTRETGETAQATAHRELIEETGFKATYMEPLASFYPSPGILDEVMHGFLATGLVHEGSTSLETHEQIQPIIESLDTVRKWLMTGRIEDAKTLALLGIYLLQKA